MPSGLGGARLESRMGVFMKVCSNCYSENSESNSVCFQCGGGFKNEETAVQTIVASSPDPAPKSSAQATPEHTDIQKLLGAIERNTQMTERNLAATRSIAIFIVGWIGWFIVGFISILLGGVLSMVPGIQVLGILLVLGGAVLILVGAVKAIANSLRELARSGQ